MHPAASAKSPTPYSPSFHVTADQVQQFLDILKQAQGVSISSTAAIPLGENEEKNGDKDQHKLRASKLDIRSVYEL